MDRSAERIHDAGMPAEAPGPAAVVDKVVAVAGPQVFDEY